jgi:hypothetical protein
VALNINNTKMISRRGRTSRKENIRGQHPLHISARIQIVIAHKCKDPNNHCNHCNNDGNTKYKCWKLHLNPMNHKKDVQKNKLVAMDSINLGERILNVDEKIFYT